MQKQTVEQAAEAYQIENYGKPRKWQEIPALTEKQLAHNVKEAFLAGAEWHALQGIEWVSVEEYKNIPKDEIESALFDVFVSLPLLLWKKGWTPVVGRQWRGNEASFFRHGAGNWQPTHYAFINLPKIYDK